MEATIKFQKIEEGENLKYTAGGLTLVWERKVSEEEFIVKDLISGEVRSLKSKKEAMEMAEDWAKGWWELITDNSMA